MTKNCFFFNHLSLPLLPRLPSLVLLPILDQAGQVAVEGDAVLSQHLLGVAGMLTVRLKQKRTVFVLR